MNFLAVYAVLQNLQLSIFCKFLVHNMNCQSYKSGRFGKQLKKNENGCEISRHLGSRYGCMFSTKLVSPTSAMNHVIIYLYTCSSISHIQWLPASSMLICISCCTAYQTTYQSFNTNFAAEKKPTRIPIYHVMSIASLY